MWYLGQGSGLSNYFCNQSSDVVEFTLFSLNHSGWNPASNCSLQQCHLSSNTNSSCLLSDTPCYDYRTLNGSRYCAPGILCSLLEPCNNITYTCASNSSVCVVNSCCSPYAVCLPLSVTNFCVLGKITFHSSLWILTRLVQIIVSIISFTLWKNVIW